MEINKDLPLKYHEMGGFPIDHGEEPIRLFRSNFLEYFTHITPQTVLFIWVPVIVFLIIKSYLTSGANGYPAVALLSMIIVWLIGIILWTFAEYFLHRFVFHYHPHSEMMKRIVFLFHGIHHAQPQCKTRLVMPPAVSIPMAFLFYCLFYFLVGIGIGKPDTVNPMVAGFMTGYLIYDLTHYATHHFPMRSRWLRFLKRHHMKHHFKTPNQRFGVSTPIWDIVFLTYPK